MRILNLVLCDKDGTDKTIRALDRNGNLYDIADIKNNLWDFLVPTRIESGVLLKNLGSYTDMQTAGWAAIQAWYNALPNLSTAHACISSSSAAHGLPTGTIHLVAHKTSTNYGSVIAYYNYPPVIRYSTINEGNWIDFTSI